MAINSIPTVIYIDPPWEYNQRSHNVSRPTKFGGGAMAHYPVMSDQQLVDFRTELEPVMSENTAMFMWATGARLDFAMKLLIEHWGFRWATVAFVWVKLNKKALTPVTTCGYYTSASCEFVLLGVKNKKGHVFRPDRKLTPQVIATPRREHSRKPDEVRTAIEKMYPAHRWVEFFARETSTGWEGYGNEVGKFDND